MKAFDKIRDLTQAIDPHPTGMKATLKTFWALIRPFWLTAPNRFAALGLFLLVLTLSLSVVWISVRLNDWNGEFYDALQQLETKKIYNLLFEFCVIAGGYVLVAVYTDWLKKKLIIDWRTWMTSDLCARWLSHDARLYRLQVQKKETENPDQRISEDIALLIELSIMLFVSFCRSVLTLVSFVAILWNLSGSLSFSVAGHAITIPGYMLWVCLVYTLIGTVWTHKIGRPLTKLNFEQQRLEADFRVNLVNVKTHAEAVAGQHGEAAEQTFLAKSFAGIAKNWRLLMDKTRNLNFFTTVFDQISSLAPIFFALPKFIAGETTLGGLMQISMAFGQVVGTLGWLIYMYEDVAKWQSTVRRLAGFEASLSMPLKEGKMARDVEDEKHLEAALSVTTAEANPLLENVKVVAKPGELTCIVGPSGIGKSTLLKTLAGFYPYAEGTMTLPVANPHWISQSTWIAQRPLMELLSYPQPASAIDVTDAERALRAVGLTSVLPDLTNANRTDWAKRLSGGEVQRLLAARVILNAPKVVLMDELTSALDTASAMLVMGALKAALPNTILILVTHQTEVVAAADHVVDLTDHAQ